MKRSLSTKKICEEENSAKKFKTNKDKSKFLQSNLADEVKKNYNKP